jgi:UDP-N-acetylmuramate-alanine ligase
MNRSAKKSYHSIRTGGNVWIFREHRWRAVIFSMTTRQTEIRCAKQGEYYARLPEHSGQHNVMNALSVVGA